MDSSIVWSPESTLQEKIIAVASQRGRSPEEIITEAVECYLKDRPIKKVTVQDDPLIGLFIGKPDLGTDSENILQQEMTDRAGWTWK